MESILNKHSLNFYVFVKMIKSMHKSKDRDLCRMAKVSPDLMNKPQRMSLQGMKLKICNGIYFFCWITVN